MSYQYHAKELVREVAFFQKYIEYKDGEYDVFYFVLMDNMSSPIQFVVKHYEKGNVVNTMKYDGLGIEELYKLNTDTKR